MAKKRRARLRTAIANPKASTSLLFMLLGFFIFGLMSGIGTEIGKHLVDKAKTKAERAHII